MFNSHIKEDKYFQDMERNLFKKAAEEICEKDNMKKEALELLNTAAEKFEQNGLIKQAELITKIAEYVSIAKDPATSGLSSKKQIQNLLHHGTPLNLPSNIKMKATPGKKDYNKSEDVIITVNEDNELNKDELKDIKNLF